MADGFTTLNIGIGGDVMDEEAVSYGSPPNTRKRTRIEVTGANQSEISRVINAPPDGTEYGLVTRNIPSSLPQPVTAPGTATVEYNLVTLVSANIETTIVSFTVPTGMSFYATGFMSTGDTPARYMLYLDGNPVLPCRTTVASPNADASFHSMAPVTGQGLMVTLRVTHYFSGILGNFEGSIFGYLM